MLTINQLLPETLAAYCGSGADWQTFNVTQKEVREDMLRLYGNKRHLVPPRSPFESGTGPATHALFLLQVSKVLCTCEAAPSFLTLVQNLERSTEVRSHCIA